MESAGSLGLEERCLQTPNEEEIVNCTDNKKVNYTLIVKNKEKKYSNVYSGTCCQKRIKDFVQNKKGKESCCGLM